LRAYQQALPDIERLGGALVAVSPMLPDGSLTMAEQDELAFDVLSDVGNGVARSYGLVFRLAPAVQELYAGPWGIRLPEHNGDESWELPVPGTFVIGRDGVVALAYVEPDHTRRLEPAAILGALGALARAGA
jgi:peroxiredoxin